MIVFSIIIYLLLFLQRYQLIGEQHTVQFSIIKCVVTTCSKLLYFIKLKIDFPLKTESNAKIPNQSKTCQYSMFGKLGSGTGLIKYREEILFIGECFWDFRFSIIHYSSASFAIHEPITSLKLFELNIEYMNFFLSNDEVIMCIMQIYVDFDQSIDNDRSLNWCWCSVIIVYE